MFAAHIKDDYVQTVQQHCVNVSTLGCLYADKLDLSNTAKLQGLLHDLGKLSVDFDNYIRRCTYIRRGDIDHAYAGAKYLYERYNENKFLCAVGYISRTIISHHGLHDWINSDGDSYFIYRVSKNDRYSEIYANKDIIFEDDEVNNLFNSSFKEITTYMQCIVKISQNPQQFLFYGGLFERLLQSILIDADRTDTAVFMKTGINPSWDVDINFDSKFVWDMCHDRLERIYCNFTDTDIISKRRTEVADQCLNFANHDVGTCRLIVPTGGGKTLSSLRFAIEYCRQHNMNRIFYIAPYMSILEQNSDVIRNIVGADYFLEHYSDFAQNIDDEEELQEYELRTENWDVPVVSTTFVQFLNTIFSDKMTSVRRFHRLTKSVIILDEVQAIPLKCVNLFNLAINFLSRVCGSTIVLCTATQPALDNTTFPIIFDNNKDMNPDFEKDFEIFHRTNLVSLYRRSPYSLEETAEFCVDKFDENGNLLVVVNTKQTAAALYELLKQHYDKRDVTIVHLSTNMCPQHRRSMLRMIQIKLHSDKPIICVTTQLIEAGVDISFKCVIRSLAGLDNAAQAAGRCNRNGEYSICPVYILNIDNEGENLRNLPEIQQRQAASISVIHSNPCTNLLSVDAMNAYFNKFYYEQVDKMSYNINFDGMSSNLVEILSFNSQRNRRDKKVSQLVGTQAFKTAGELFHVIDESTVSVVVPYDKKAIRLINQLNSNIDIRDMKTVFRKLQKYTISIYLNRMRKFEQDGIIYKTMQDIWVLNKTYYDRHIGLNLAGTNLELLNY